MKQKALTTALALAICLGLFPAWGVARAYPSDPVVEIATAEELVAFARQVRLDRSTSGRLVADIDLSGQGIWEPMGGAWDDSGYSGTFDGNGHTITGLFRGSLFHCISQEGVIRDLTLSEVNITGRAPLANISFGRVENCRVDGRVSAYDQMYVGA